MTLAPGVRLGLYEVTALIGEGGMGKVWRAHHTALKRDDALKVLPDAFAHDPDRLARFRREAQVLASLNHPNIAHVYGLEQSDGVQALVMELVEGPTLADRIAQGPIPVDEALPIARQISDALETAHEQGIIHRDLKPANIKVRPDGTVKVLDFGLAKAMEPAASSRDASQSPTITSPAMTQMGVILGTAAYMSPEQAKGRAADKRSDAWAFGCVLYEMLTGERAFDGEDVSDTLAAVLRSEPDWTAFPPGIPLQLRTLVRRCLEKDRKARIPDMAVARFMLDDTSAAAATTPAASVQASTKQVERRGWIAAALLGMAFLTVSGLAAYVYFSQAPTDARAIRFTVAMPDGWSLAVAGFPSPGAPPLTVSPDGRRIAFVATSQGTRHLWVRPIDSVQAQELPGTEGAVGPFWAPDSRVLAFFADGRLKKIDVTGGPPVTLCAAPMPMGGAWSPEGFIIFGSTGTGKGLQRVGAAGGVPTVLTTLAQDEIGHTRPSLLPDGRHFFYRVLGRPGGGPLYISSIDSTERTLVMERPDASNVIYTAGYLLFLRETTLMAQPFDLERLVLTGEPVPVAEQVLTLAFPPMAIFSASQTGVLAYQTGARTGSYQLTWFDRSGTALGTFGDPASYESIELSPEGKRVAVSILDRTQGTRDVWIVDVARGLRTRFTFDPANETLGRWSPNGDRFVFVSNRDAQPGIYLKPSNGPGSEEVLVASTSRSAPNSWSPDGRFLLYDAEDGKSSNLWVLPLSGERKPEPFLQTDFREESGRFSPDGRWIAYRSNESGRFEVYVTPFPGPGQKWQVSTAGGGFPRWRGDGKEIFYVAADNRLMAAEVNGQGNAFEVGAARPLFELDPAPGGYGYDVAGDAQRFIVRVPVDPSGSEPLDVVLNWTAGLRN